MIIEIAQVILDKNSSIFTFQLCQKDLDCLASLIEAIRISIYRVIKAWADILPKVPNSKLKNT